MEKIRIVIADDHKMFLDGLCSLLEDEENLEIVDTAKNGNGVLQILSNTKIDLVITDISMPEMNGIALNNEIKKKHTQVKTLVLSMHKQSDLIAKLIKNGANGYLLKNADKKELLQAINSIMRGENYFSPEVKEAYMQSMFSPKATRKAEAKLSRREKEVITLIAQEMTTNEIAEKLFISQHTVETHRKNILRKLDARNTAGLVKYAIQQGLVQ